MKILLFTTPWRFSETSGKLMHSQKYGWIKKLLAINNQSVMGPFPPLGLLYLSSVLKNSGHQVTVLDGFFVSKEDILKKIEKGQFGLIGLSTITCRWKKDCTFLQAIKEKFPLIPIVIGGSHATGWRENCFKDSKAIDYLVCHDGEDTLLELVRSLEEKGDVAQIKGLLWRKEGTGEVVANEDKNFLTDLDTLPFPDWEAVDIYKYIPTLTNYKKLPSIDMIGSRGCFFECIFCHSSKVVRKRSVENILAEIDILVKDYGIRDITFYDETFTVFPDKVRLLCEELIKRNYNLSWAANARGDSLSKELLLKMKEAGCWRLLFGIESGSQSVLDTLRKKTTISGLKEAVAMTKACGIEVHGTMLFGTPGETYEEALKTIVLARELDLDYVAFGAIAPFPGTELFNMIDNPLEYDFDKMNLLTVSYIPDSLTKEELERLLKISYRKFYFRLGYLYKRIKKIRSFEDLRKNIVGFLGMLDA